MKIDPETLVELAKSAEAESPDDSGLVSEPTDLEKAAKEFIDALKDYDSKDQARQVAKSFKAMSDICSTGG